MSTPEADRRTHWEDVYLGKDEPQLSWHQDSPALSLALVRRYCPPGGAVLDVGGGTSLLGSELAASGHARVTVLDVSPAALRRARERAGGAGERVRWVVGDVCGPAWPAPGPYDVWHDRAVLHFLTDPEDRRRYAARVRESVPPGGHVVIAAFALGGPARCSGLPVRRYDAESLERALAPGVRLVEARREVHATPWGREQPFVYGVLRRDEGDPVRSGGPAAGPGGA